MIATVEGKPRLSETIPAGSSPAEWSAREPVASGPASGREAFVIGIFSGSNAANAAIRGLASTLKNGADAVLLSQTDDFAVAFRHPFDARSTSPRIADEPRPRFEGSPHASWLEQNLTQHLADGASVVIVRTSEPEQQLAISRALLDLGCDVLLAHDVTAPTSDTDGNQVHNPVIFR